MNKNSPEFRFLIIGFICLIAVFSFPQSILYKFSSGINDLSNQYTYNFIRKSASPYKIISIAIDDYSLSRVSQRWPWKRSLYAKLIKLLDQEKVKAIGIDFAFVGTSEDKQDDSALADALRSSSSRIVLAYVFDYKNASPVLPLFQLRDAAYALGMVNTPIDPDGKARRLRGYIKSSGNMYYSFPVAISAAFLNEKPEIVAARIPLLRDKTFWVNFLVKPKDVISISFSEALDNLEGLKKIHGNDFLNGALVLVHPQAEILHDTHLTPLGKMPGGILHLNGVLDLLSGKLVREVNILTLFFLLLSAAAIFYILKVSGFLSGFFFTLGVLVLNLWILVLFNISGVRFDFSRIFLFSLLFFFTSSLYKYIFFLSELLKIKDKATLDPLRGIFTLRYFYYRLQLESEKIYFGRELYFIIIYLGDFEEAFEGKTTDELKDIWRKISGVLFLNNSFWSFYPQETLVGGIILPQHKLRQTAVGLKNNLASILREGNPAPVVKCAFLKFRKEYVVAKIVPVLTKELRVGNEDIVFLKDDDLSRISTSLSSPEVEKGGLLGTLYGDIEEKNSQLLKFIGDLNLEHARTKEAFFEIITSLVHALEARDPYTEGHSQRVAQYSILLAEKLGWGKEEKEKLKKAALLHDLGKIGIPDNVLHKRGALTEEEYKLIKQHEIIAVKILEPLKDLQEILPWILYHHERWDGTGYPHGIAGNAIPQAAQIISLCDVYDALSTGRDYKTAFSFEETSKLLLGGRGTQFNPQLLDTFIKIIRARELEK